MKTSRIAALVSSFFLGAALTLTGAGAAQADSSALAVDYVALGDSYSSGVGAGAYDSASGTCLRTPVPTPPSGRPPTPPRRSPSPPARARERPT